MGKEKLPSISERGRDQSPSHISRFPASKPNPSAKTTNKARDDDTLITDLVKKADSTPIIDTAKLVALKSSLDRKKYNIDTAGIASKILHFEAQLRSSDDE